MSEHVLMDMSVSDVEEFLSHFEFVSPAHTYYSDYRKMDVDVPEQRDQGWDAIYEYCYTDEGYSTPIGKVRVIDSHGGEGQGDQYWMILSVVQGDDLRTFKMDGWYASHYGHEFDGPFTEVKPKLKTVTVWE